MFRRLFSPSIFCAMLTIVGCSKDPPKKSVDAPEAVPTAIPTVELDKIEINGKERIVLAKINGAWTMTQPVEYPVLLLLAKRMEKALGEFEVVGKVENAGAKYQTLQVDEKLAIEVAAWADDKLLGKFLIGATRKDVTFLRIPGGKKVYQVRGLPRRYFDQSARVLRDPSVTNIEMSSISSVTIENEFGLFELTFNEDNKPVYAKSSIRNFDEEKARKVVTIAANLFARDFVDSPTKEEISDFDSPSIKVKIVQKNAIQTVVLVGDQFNDKRLSLVKSSQSKHLFKVPTYVTDSLKIKVADFERTDEQMARQQRQSKTADDHAAEHERRHLTEAMGVEPMMIDFTRDNCVPCKIMAPWVDLIREQYKGRVEVFEINLDRQENSRLGQAYKVMSVPMQVYVRDGDEQARHAGLATTKAMKSLIDKHLLKSTR